MAALDQILRGTPLSLAQLRRVMGRNPLYDFLAFHATADIVHFFDDFLGDTINLDYWALADSGGTGKADFATNVQAGGVVRGTTGTTDDGSISAIGPLIYKGDKNCGLEVRLKVDAVTDLNLEVGFIDAVPGSNGSGVSDVDTPAATATDAALVQMDTDQTLKTLAFVTAGTAFTTTATAAAGLTAPVAATYFTVRIELRGNTAKCWLNGRLEGNHQGDKVEGGTLLAPWIYARTRSTVTKNVDLDYVRVWCER